MKKTSLKENFVMNILLTTSSVLFSLVTFPYASRVLLPEGTGRVAFALSIVSYFSMMASLGIPTYGIRACAQVQDDPGKLNQVVQEIFLINAGMTVLAYGCYFCALLLVGQMRQEKTLFLICSSTLFFNLIGMEWLYKGLEQYRYIALRSLGVRAAAIILMLLLVRSQSDYLMYGALTVLANVGSNILNFINIRRVISLAPCKKYHLRRHLRPVFTFFALTVAVTIYTNLDVAMLGFLTSDQQVGYYNAAVKIKGLLVSFVTALWAVLLPRSSHYVSEGRMDEFSRLIRKAFGFSIFMTAPMVIYFLVMARRSILLVSGPAYGGSVLPMRIITPTIFCIGLTNMIGMQMLVPTGKEKLVVISTCAGAVTDVILNLCLIPRYASAGAALGTLVAEIVVLVVQLWTVRTELPGLLAASQLPKITAALVPATAVLIGVQHLMERWVGGLAVQVVGVTVLAENTAARTGNLAYQAGELLGAGESLAGQAGNVAVLAGTAVAFLATYVLALWGMGYRAAFR